LSWVERWRWAGGLGLECLSAGAVAGLMCDLILILIPVQGGGFGFARAFDFLLQSLPRV